MIKIYLISIILGFVVGFLTNWIAILSLFRPRKKILGFQGLIPRYKKEIGKKISENAHMIMPPSFKKLLKIPFIGKKIDTFFKDSVASEIAKMPDEELEKIVKNITSKELKFIELIGGVIGMLIGLLQAILISLVI